MLNIKIIFSVVVIIHLIKIQFGRYKIINRCKKLLAVAASASVLPDVTHRTGISVVLFRVLFCGMTL